jgi:signal transduction histidine kinase
VTDRTGAGARVQPRAAARQPNAEAGSHTAATPAAQQAADELDSLCAGHARAELQAVSSAVLAVTKHLSVREVLQTIVTAARSLLQADYAALGVPDSIGSFAEFVVDGISDEQWAAIGPLPRQHGLLGIMLQEARPQRLADITKDPRFVGDWPPAHPELKDFLGMPVMDGEDILGAIYLANKRGGAGFTDADERMLSVLAAHAAIALTNARLYEQSRELTIVQERQRIARELHDAVAQKLFSLRLTADAAAALAELDPAKAAAQLATVRRLAAEAADELRQVVIELMPADLAGDGLPAVLGKQVDVLNRVGGTTVTLVVEGWRRLPIDREEAVLRVAQEALHNAMRHAEASSITVRLAAADSRAELVVEDNGVGFDVSAATRGAHRLGLASMRERARTAGGRLSVRSRPRSGTTVTLEVPLR